MEEDSVDLTYIKGNLAVDAMKMLTIATSPCPFLGTKETKNQVN